MNDPPLWFLDAYSNKIYASDSTSTWSDSLNQVQILNATYLLSKSHIVTLRNDIMRNSSFYAILFTETLQFLYCTDHIKCSLIQEFETSWDRISSSIYSNTEMNAFIGTDIGVFNISIYNYLNNTNPMSAKLNFEQASFDKILHKNENKDIVSLAFSNNLNILAVGTRERVYRFNLSYSDFINNNMSYDYTWTFGLVDSLPNDMVFLYDDLYIANRECVNVLRYFDINEENANNMQFWIRIGNHQLLPYNKVILTVLGWDNSIWFAHKNIIENNNTGSISRFNPNYMNINVNKNNSNSEINGEWRYYIGNRYLTPTDIVTMYGAKHLNMIFIATTYGISVISGNQTDLETKANQIELINYPRHDRYGLCGTAYLYLYGNLTSWHPMPDDNNGLWTSMYLSGLAFKYATSPQENTLSLIWYHTNAISMLHNVTGIKGLVARSYALITDGRFSGHWVNSTTMAGWQWKADTSSDEICGHIYVYAILYDVVATTFEEKTFILNMMISIIDYILENGYKLIDYNGNPTTWGFWDPYSLNDQHKYYDERGINSLQILSWIMACYYYTNIYNLEFSQTLNTDNYLQQWQYLGIDNKYFMNVLNQKITIPDDINHSDDELAALSYLVYFWVKYQYKINENKYKNTLFSKNWNNYIKNKYIYFDMSWNRTYTFIESPYQSWYSIIQYIANNINDNNDNDFDNETLRKYVIQDLERWPMEWIDFPIENQYRTDIILDYTMGRSCGDKIHPTCSRNIFPHDQTNEQRWNGDAYSCDTGNGYQEIGTGGFTMSYWMAKYFQMF